MEQQSNNIKAAIDAGLLIGAPKSLGPNLVGVVVPQGTRLEQLDLQVHELRPRRKSGLVTLATAASFIAWVNRNKTPETVIYAKESDTSFLAIFNGHEANHPPAPAVENGTSAPSEPANGAPGWGDFTSRYGCPLSEEWKRWFGKSQHAADPKKGMPHAEFLMFIEENLVDIKTPASGQLLATLGRFEARRDVKIVSGKRLDNGDVAFAYSEDTVQVTEGQSDLKLPSQITIAVPIFKGGAIYEIDALLRYRATPAQGLILWFELLRPHKSLEHAFASVSKAIEDGTSVPMFST